MSYRDDLAALQAALESTKQQLAEQTTLREQAENAALTVIGEAEEKVQQAQLATSYMTNESGQRRLRWLSIGLCVAALAGLTASGVLVFKLGQSRTVSNGQRETINALRDQRNRSKAALAKCQAALASAHNPPQLDLRCEDPKWAKPLYPVLARFYRCLGKGWDFNATKPIHVVISFNPVGETNKVLLRNANTGPGQQLCLLQAAQTLEPPLTARGALAFSLYPEP